MSIAREPRIKPLPRWKIETVGGWAKYVGISIPTMYKAIREGRFLVRADDVFFQPAPRGKPVRKR